MSKLVKISTLSLENKKLARKSIKNSIEQIESNFEADEKISAVAPFLLQKALSITEPIGIVINRQLIYDKLQNQTWDKVVAWVGVDELNNFNHTLVFYDSEDRVINLGGGGGTGVPAQSAPEPKPPTANQ